MKKIDWTKWSAIAEILSSIAIVLTLFYLAVQTSQNTAAIQATSRQGVLNGELWLLDKFIEHPSLGFGGALDVPGLSSEESLLYENILNGHFRIRENLWLQYQSGALDEATWESYRNIFISLMEGDSTMRQYWEFLSPLTMDQAFVADINKALEPL